MLADFQNSFTVIYSAKFATKKPCYISHHTVDMSLHYLAKYKRPKLAKFCGI